LHTGITPIALTLVAALLAAGCAAIDSGIAPTAEPNGYVITEAASPTRGGGMEPGRIAIAKADAFCRDRDRRFVPIDIAGIGWPVQDPITGPRGVRLTFRCAAPRDQQLNVGTP
jgi:hypothetical protein